MPAAYGAGYGYVLTALRAYASAAVLCARATPLRAYARPFLRPQRGRQFPLAKFLTSAVGRCLFPLAIYGEGVADRPGVRSIPPQTQHSSRTTSYLDR